MTAKRILSLSAGTLLLSALQITAGTFTANFNDCVTAPCAPPSGTAIFAGPEGGAVIEPTGGVGNSGVLKLTKAVNSQLGSFVITNDLDTGMPVNGFNLSFKVRVGGGTATPADGFSVVIGPDVPEIAFGEEGPAGFAGLVVSFDTYDNAEGAPEITLHWGGSVIRDTPVPISFLRTTNEFVDVQIKLDPDGSLDVVYRGNAVYSDVFPPNFQPLIMPRYGFGARTGGLNENQWVDDIQLTTTTGTLAAGFSTSPRSATIREGGQYTLRAAINDPGLVTGFQWQQLAPGAADFTDIAGATDTNFTAGPFTLAQSGTQFRIRASTLDAPVFSRTATVSVVSIPVPAADVTYDFNDGALPLGAAVYGTAMVTFDGGVDNTGVLRLTEATGNQGGTFIINDIAGGQAVGAMTATFKARVGDGSVPPADGFSFNWANNLPDAHIGAGEEGVGNGLTIAFDIYDNAGGEAPAVDVKFAGTNIASAKVPLNLLETGTNFVDVIVQMRSTGAVDVVYNNIVLHNAVPVPGWSALGNGRFAFAGRTGGLNAAQYIDNIGLSTTRFAGSLAFTRQPAGAAAVVGGRATFSAEVNDPGTAAFQWQRLSSGTTFTNIPGATTASFTTPAATLADNAARYRVVVTGPVNTITSEEAVLTVVNLGRPTTPNASFDFNDCVTAPCAAPAGTRLFGLPADTAGIIEPTGGVTNSGVLVLTKALDSQNAAWVIDTLNPGEPVGSFLVAFDAFVDGGNPALPPADGYSFSWGTDVIDGLDTTEAEEGSGTGLIVTFDLWNSSAAGQPAEAPAIDVKWRGQTVAHKLVPTATLETADSFKQVLINLEQDGTVDVSYGGELIHNNVVLTNFAPLVDARFAFAARTGGANENQFLDNVAIQTAVFTGSVTFVDQPIDQMVLPGGTASFSATVNDPTRATFQWQARAPGAATFTNITGATTSSLTTPALTAGQSNTEFRLLATGPGSTATSRVARVTVIATTPTASFNFDDCVTPPCPAPPGTALFRTGDTAGTAAGFIDATGGVNGSGVLKLTIAANSLGGSFIVNDPNTNAVNEMTASFDVRMGGGSSPPADGMSFVWAGDLADGQFGEDGAGSGLVVTFDLWNNSAAGAPPEAPAIDVRWAGVELAHTGVPLSFIETGDAFAPVIVRVENDGTLDLAYKNQLIYSNLVLPGFTNIVGGRFGWGARTGGANENHFVDNIQIATSTSSAPRVNISRAGNNITVTWTEGRLQSAPDITGPWTDVAGATGGSYTAAATGDRRFFRTVNP